MNNRDFSSGGTLSPAQKQQAGSKGRLAKRRREKRLQNVLSILLILLLWAGMVYGGYFYALKHMQNTKQHFLNEVNALKLENQRIEEEISEAMQLFRAELKNSNQEIRQIHHEMSLVREELELTGESISGSDQTRLSLQERITELDEQLAGLKEQLRKLEEAARAF